MKQLFYICLTAMFFSTGAFAQEMPVNPFIRIDSTSYPASQNRRLYTADPSARVFNVGGTPTLFVYPSHDMEPAYGCDMMNNYHVFSTTDMLEWTDHGRIFGAAEAREAWGLDYPIRNGGRNASFMWAPDCVEKNGVYYYYFPHPLGYPDKEGWDNWRTGIATATSPDMKENFAIHDTTLLGLPAMGYIDPHIFKDSNGEYYFYYGGSQKCFGAKLADDMLSLAEPLKEMTNELPHFHEGAWVIKRNGIYYMIYPGNSSNLQNYVAGQDQMLYAVSTESPLGPWTYKGSFLDATGCDTSHGSVVEFNGQWYVFYHNSSLSGQGNLRSICVDLLFFEANGDIRRVVQTGEDRNINRRNLPAIIQFEDFKNGGEGVGFHEKSEENTGGLPYRLGLSKSVDIASTEEGVFITNLEAGEWLAYDINVNAADTFVIEVRVASIAEGKFRIENEAGETIATINVPNTGGMNTWKSIIVHDILLAAGNQTLKFVVETGGFNLNYFMLTLEGKLPIGKILSFGQSGIYVTLAAGNQLRCTKSAFASSQLTNTEKFLIEDAGDGLIALKSLSNNRYASASSNVMTCINTTIGANNKFYWCILKDGVYRNIALKSFANNQVVQNYRNDTNKPLRTSGYNFGEWEDFNWYDMTPTTDVANIENDSRVTLYPVPAGDTVTIATELNNVSDIDIFITDLQGKILQTEKKNVNSGLSEININIGGIAAGIYLVNVISNEFNVVKKLIVN